MKLLYTVSSAYMAAQTKSIYSIGGFPSSTQVPNDVFSNLFDELSLLTIKNAKTEYRAIVLQNDSDKVTSNVQMWFEVPEDAYCNFQIGATVLTQSTNDEQYMELIPSIYSKPFNTQLYDATEDSRVTIGDIEPGQMIGLWISRSINKERAMIDYNKVAEIDPLATFSGSRYKPIVHNQEETLKLQIIWEDSL